MTAEGVPEGVSCRLRELFEGLDADLSKGAGEQEVRDVTSDSRRVGRGSLFIATRGERFDGHDFVPAAAAAGAVAAVVEEPPSSPIPFALVRDSRRAAGPVAAAFHGRPSEGMRLVGVTGTNGKTTVAWLLDEFFYRETAGSLYCGTVGHRARVGGRLLEPTASGLTTREAPELQSLLATALASAAAPERSSVPRTASGKDGSRAPSSRRRFSRTSPATISIFTAGSTPTSRPSGNSSRICSVPAGRRWSAGMIPMACGSPRTCGRFVPT